MSVLRAIAVFLCGFLSLRICRAQIVFPGTCPDVEAMKNFDAERYLGRWYEVEKYFAFFELGGRCITADYGQKDDLITVTNKQINNITGSTNEIKGYATKESGEADEAKLSVYFPKMPINIAAPYWIVGTDYDSYSVIWSCYEFGTLFNTRNAWILTRQRNPPKSVLKAAYKVTKENNIDQSYFTKTDQTNCTVIEDED
ncbi:PREDICTED: apolipoprotein D-like [Papilio xuthus]|uniref:Apolipoprotein D n=1 Tax=Papilio xuthus TaxID=66420 RepID=A0AAJ7EG50_PAPXU|nr:PREDICTED: apolipoprotein D-like [Papilio xuthus]